MKDDPQNLIEYGLSQPADLEVESSTENEFGYGRLFPEAEQYPFNINDLTALGNYMTREGNKISDSEIPAGYTYLGQFIDHEISNAVVSKQDPPNITLMRNTCSPFFDLESLYGKGPNLNPELYRDGVFLKLGMTIGENTGGVKRQFLNDLPRKPGTTTAEIVDLRNDENLITAQIQVVFIKFHNAVAEWLKNQGSTNLFAEARDLVVRHFQWIVLNDFLPRIVKKNVFDEVFEGLRKCYSPDSEKPVIPIEFSGAAFRFGHSLVRISYEWNKVFNPNGLKGPLDISDLMTFTGHGGLSSSMVKREQLPSAWIVDWRRFFELPKPDGIKLNNTLKIDTQLAPKLGALPGGAGVVPGVTRFSLATTNLGRGFEFKLPTGQKVAEIMGITPLSSDDLDSVLPSGLQAKFNKQTPLWYYILAESEKREQGKTLGEIGSRLVAETLFGLVEVSPISILKEPQWYPTLGQVQPEEFRMPDLLNFIASQSRFGEAELNPVGD